MLFRQSPYNAREVYVLTTGSQLFKVTVPDFQVSELVLTLDIEKQLQVLTKLL